MHLENFVFIFAAELEIKNFMEQNPGVFYVDKEVFRLCHEEIRTWLDNSVLLPYLKKYGVVMDFEDEKELLSPYSRLQDQFTSLIDLVERQGECGFMLLYMCIHESSSESEVPDHKDAVTKLDLAGKLS